MSIWDILEIEATQDIKSIKKAYARKLKQYHPEDDPTGYQQLREAYDEATRYAKNAANYLYIQLPENEWAESEENLAEENAPVFNQVRNLDDSQVETLDVKPRPLYEETLEGAGQPDFEKMNEEFILNMKEIYADFFRRVDIHQWVSLFDGEVIWNIYNREIIGEEVLEFLNTHRNLPQDIWLFLNLNFNWVSKIDSYDGSYEEVIEYIEERLQEKEELSYTFDDNITEIDYETYLSFREKAHRAAKNRDINTAYNFLYKAKAIYPIDPELLFLEGKCLCNKRKAKESITYFNALLNKVPNHCGGLLYRSIAYMSRQKYALALQDIQKIESYSPENEEMLYMMGRCHRMLKNYDIAKSYLMKLSTINPGFEGIEELLNKINKSMLHHLKMKLMINPFNRSLLAQYKDLKKEIAKSKGKSSVKKKIIKAIIYTFLFILFAGLMVSSGVGAMIALIFLLKFIYKKVKRVET